MKSNKLTSKLPQNLQIIPTKAAQNIKGGNADSTEFIIEDNIDGL